MLEARKLEWKQLLYTYHAAMAPNRPATIGIDYGKASQTRLTLGAELEQLGLTHFHENHTLKEEMTQAFPETFGLTDAEIEELPKYVRQMKCGGKIEAGDPGCGQAKFNKTICSKRKKGVVKWHPGW